MTKLDGAILGDNTTTNQWLVDNLKKKLQRKCLLVEHLQNEMQHIEHTTISKMNFDMEKTSPGYRQQMKQLQEELEVSVQDLQASNSMIYQRDSAIGQLQTHISLLKNTRIDNDAFKRKASKMNEKMETAQKDLYQSMDIIQKYYQMMNNSLKNIHEKEKEALCSQIKFPEIYGMETENKYSRACPFFTVSVGKRSNGFKILGDKP
jgi:uncharacterized protein (DUF3084 family)